MMRDLNLGPESKKLIDKYRASRDDKSFVADDMADMLERWLDVAWCWTDAGPARICGGPHVRVKYQHDRMITSNNPVEVIEQVQHAGETFPDVPFTIIK
jgi:hypothetical protein